MLEDGGLIFYLQTSSFIVQLLRSNIQRLKHCIQRQLIGFPSSGE